VTYENAMQYARETLKPMNLTMPDLECRELVAAASEAAGMIIKAGDVPMLRGLEAPSEIKMELDAMLERRLRGEPLAYIIGEWDFYGITLEVNADVLIPRADTETLIEPALQFIKDIPSPRVLDLCCGSGAIGIAILMHNPNAQCVFADLSAPALRVCKRNLQKYSLDGRAEAIILDALEPVEASLGKFDLIISNPPYITADEMNALPVDVAGFEPRDALYGGYDGLSFYRSIAVNFKTALKSGAHVLFEHGAYQSFEVCEILKQHGYEEIKKYEDLNQYPRAVSARVL